MTPFISASVQNGLRAMSCAITAPNAEHPDVQAACRWIAGLGQHVAAEGGLTYAARNGALDAMQALDELRTAAVAFTIQAAIEAGVFIEDPTALRALEKHLLATVNRPCQVMTHDMWCVTADLMAAGHVNPFVAERRRKP